MSNNQHKVKNKIKVKLVERGRTNRWLALKMNKSENTISRWCSNKNQPSVQTLGDVASILGVSVNELICLDQN